MSDKTTNKTITDNFEAEADTDKAKSITEISIKKEDKPKFQRPTMDWIFNKSDFGNNLNRELQALSRKRHRFDVLTFIVLVDILEELKKLNNSKAVENNSINKKLKR